jgi:hypothetical protein
MSLLCMPVKLNPDASSLPKNAGGVVLAVAVMWATTSRTVHSPHSEGAAHCWSLSAARSEARALRSLWTVGQISIVPPSQSSW